MQYQLAIKSQIFQSHSIFRQSVICKKKKPTWLLLLCQDINLPLRNTREDSLLLIYHIRKLRDRTHPVKLYRRVPNIVNCHLILYL